MDLQQSDVRHANGALRLPSQLRGTRLWNSEFLASAERDALTEAVLPAKKVKAGTDLIREGERIDTLFVITDGWACRYATTREGARYISAFFVPGDVCNLDALVFDRPDQGIRTISETSLVALSHDRAQALAARHAGIAQTFTWLALLENAILAKWALSLGRRSAKERLAHLLCELSVRLNVADTGESSFAFPMTQEQLGDAVGLTSVSREPNPAPTP